MDSSTPDPVGATSAWPEEAGRVCCVAEGRKLARLFPEGSPKANLLLKVQFQKARGWRSTKCAKKSSIQLEKNGIFAAAWMRFMLGFTDIRACHH